MGGVTWASFGRQSGVNRESVGSQSGEIKLPSERGQKNTAFWSQREFKGSQRAKERVTGSQSGVSRESIGSQSGVNRASIGRHLGVTWASIGSQSGVNQASIGRHLGVTWTSLGRQTGR